MICCRPFPSVISSPSGGGGFVGPLDDYTTNLAAAYLPFRGFTSYTSFSCEIRDTTGDALQNVGFDAVTGMEDAITTTGNAAIKTWYDQSGNGRDLLGATNGSQPLRIAAVLNGYPVARFDGVDDAIKASWTATETARTIYIIAKKRTAANNASYDPLFKIADSTVATISCNVGPGYYYFSNEAFSGADVGGTSTDWTLVAVKFTNASTAQAWLNNTASSTFDPRIEYQNGGLTLGGDVNDWADIDIAACLLYNAAHDDTLRQAIQTILADAFNITLA